MHSHSKMCVRPLVRCTVEASSNVIQILLVIICCAVLCHTAWEQDTTVLTTATRARVRTVSSCRQQYHSVSLTPTSTADPGSSPAAASTISTPTLHSLTGASSSLTGMSLKFIGGRRCQLDFNIGN